MRIALASAKQVEEHRALQRERERAEGIPSEAEFTEFYDSLSLGEKAAMDRAARNAPLVGPQPGPQMDAYVSQAKVLGYGGAAGGGKGGPQSVEIIGLFPGKLNYGSVKEGDSIPDSHGGVQRVLRVKNWGDWAMRKVSFSDGTSTIVSPEHEWVAWRAHEGTKKRSAAGADASGRVFGPAAARKMETDFIRSEMKRGRRYRIPLCDPVRGNYNKYKINPYLLGAMLGDGYMGHGQCNLGIAAEDSQIAERINAALDMPMTQSIQRDGTFHVWRLSTKSKEYVRLRDMGMMNKRAWEKGLPKSARFAPIEWRWELLRGLMDTDGNVEPRRCAYYCTTSPMLRDGVAQLARSLGCFVTITNKAPSYVYKGEKRQGRPAYVLRIKSATPEKLFRRERKRKIAAELEHQSLAKEIVDVDDAPREDCICISVDHPSSLYLTNDYTVTHNSALIALLAVTAHRRTVIFRNDAKQLSSLIDDLAEFAGTSVGMNRQHNTFRFINPEPGKPAKLVEWGGLGTPGAQNQWKGRPHDLVAYDEVTELPKHKVVFVKNWLRTTDKGQRTRAIMTFNPPGGADDKGDGGRWIIDFFAPWIYDRYVCPFDPNKGKAAYGELRYFMTDADGEEVEVEDHRARVLNLRGVKKVIYPESRTFIQALLKDNAYLAGGDYEQNLLNQPEPLRSMYYFGDFSAGMMDDAFQVIPTQWIEAAVDRGRVTPTQHDHEMSALGCDVARGGLSNTVFVPRHGWWFGMPDRKKGKDTPDGPIVGRQCLERQRDNALICIDVIGVGSSPFDWLKEKGENVQAINYAYSKDENIPRHLRQIEIALEMANLRSYLYWLARKILDPSNGIPACLPDDNPLIAELKTPRYRKDKGVILVESKEDIYERTGYGMDNADAFVNSLYNFHNTPGALTLYGGMSRERKQHFLPADQQRMLALQRRLKRHTAGADASRNAWMGY